MSHDNHDFQLLRAPLKEYSTIVLAEASLLTLQNLSGVVSSLRCVGTTSIVQRRQMRHIADALYDLLKEPARSPVFRKKLEQHIQQSPMLTEGALKALKKILDR